jgi:hypothetical protein
LPSRPVDDLIPPEFALSGLSRLLTLLVVLVAIPNGDASAAEQPSETSAATVDDWDWGGFTGLDDAPVTGRAAPSASPPNLYDVPRVGETALPDFDAPVREAYAVFRDVPPFEVIPSQRDPGMHPCSSCHQWVVSDPQPRNLKRPHDNFKLEHGLHGKGKFWCFTCHDLEGKGALRTLEGEKLDYADAYVLCSQCHANQARDWVYGAHGKRVSGWQGKRQVLNCTACHYQHRPAFKPRAPESGPVVRVGLERPAHWVEKDDDRAQVHGYGAVWEQVEDGAAEGASLVEAEGK